MPKADIRNQVIIRLCFFISCLAVILSSCSQINLPNPLPNFKATEQALTAIAQTQQQLLATARVLATLAAGGEIPTQPVDTPTFTPTPSPTHTRPPTATATTPQTPTPSKPSAIGPSDIPILSGEIFNLFRTINFISYETALDLPGVATFYDTEMVASGWVKNAASSYISTVSATLLFEKTDRIAKISLQSNTVAKRTTIIISITNR